MRCTPWSRKEERKELAHGKEGRTLSGKTFGSLRPNFEKKFPVISAFLVKNCTCVLCFTCIQKNDKYSPLELHFFFFSRKVRSKEPVRGKQQVLSSRKSVHLAPERIFYTNCFFYGFLCFFLCAIFEGPCCVHPRCVFRFVWSFHWVWWGYFGFF